LISKILKNKDVLNLIILYFVALDLRDFKKMLLSINPIVYGKAQ